MYAHHNFLTSMLTLSQVNTIRVYNLNPNATHDECASVFYTAGIYMILDVNTPFVAIDRDDPASTYDVDYLNHIFSVVEAFKDYPNTLAFFAANELINDANTSTIDPPYIRVCRSSLDL
jgi:1,3-beta-glucanosyltransferase GAS3